MKYGKDRKSLLQLLTIGIVMKHTEGFLHQDTLFFHFRSEHQVYYKKSGYTVAGTRGNHCFKRVKNSDNLRFK